MKNFIICLLCTGLTFYAFKSPKPAAKQQTTEPFALMELYTSEGCSNCPPAYLVADSIVQSGKQNNKRIYLLDFHVDYFNDTWQDPYSCAQNTKRQQSYQRIFQDEGLYTPQMIINGSSTMVGSSSDLVDKGIDDALKNKPQAFIDVQNARLSESGIVLVSFRTKNIPEDSAISVALVQNVAIQKVLKGENAGKTLTHYNVVRDMAIVPSKDGVAQLSVPTGVVATNGSLSVVVFRQDLGSMKILAVDEKAVATR